MSETVFMNDLRVLDNFEKSSMESDNFSKYITNHLLTRTNSIDFTLVKARTVRVLKWDDERANHAIQEYKKMLVMARLGIHVVPGKDIDEIWHSHILFTKKYIDDCHEFFGYYLHHKPADGSTEEDNEKRKLSHSNMMKKYKEIFGYDTPSSWYLNYKDPCGSMGCDVGCEG